MNLLPQSLDPLHLPLTGLRVIEASAGTGKTWTLAALYLRLVLGSGPDAGDGLPPLVPPRILVMTFTEAATAELRARIRQRLAQAARFFAGLPEPEGEPPADPFLHALRQTWPQAHWPLAARRLDLAAQWMDEAAIHTLHGWCHRVLRTHALGSASLFEQEPLPDPGALQRQAVHDHWRHWFYPQPAPHLALLRGWASDPDTLLQTLRRDWAAQERDPAHTWPDGPEPPALWARWADWHAAALALAQAVRQGWTPERSQALDDLAEAKVLKGWQKNWRTSWLRQMAAWVNGPADTLDIEPRVLARFGRSALHASGLPPAHHHPVFDAIDALGDHLAQAPDTAAGLRAHAARSVWTQVQGLKARQARFDFADLLQRLHHALHAPGSTLADALRTQYPVALVDEFQDTDPWQYGSLQRIYAPGPPTPPLAADAPASGLLMIGDPKQAIYSFRGADLATYLRARSHAASVHTLPDNHRSSAPLVAAINHVFTQRPQPFGPGIVFEPVAAQGRAVPLTVDGVEHPALTVWHARFERTPGVAACRQHMAAVCATEIVALLQAGAAEPADMAVLVRDGADAAAVRQALAGRGVRSVYLSERSSVWASAEATDLWRLLQAVHQPRQPGPLRAALATRLWGLDWAELAHRLDDEDTWNTQVERLTAWQALWQRQGLWPLLQRWLHEEGVARRLLATPDGERRLTNLLHLADLLQTASTQVAGEGGLLRHLHDQIVQAQSPHGAAEDAQLRLESDDGLVQVVTQHKSKGLEYPLVFLPFAAHFRAEDQNSGRPDAERLHEDMRLLYVALTRARRALWLGAAELQGDADGKKPAASALSVLLGRQAPGDLGERLQAWARCPHIQVVPAPEPRSDAWADTRALPARQPPLPVQRLLRNRWWTASFSRLSLGAGPWGDDARDERMGDAQIDAQADPLADFREADGFAPPSPWQAFPAGSRSGTLLHDLLQWQCEHGWPLAQSDVSPPVAGEWTAFFKQKMALALVGQDFDALVSTWLEQAIRVPLRLNGPLDAPTLAGLGPGSAWAEMGFTLPVGSAQAQALDALVARHLLPGRQRPPLQPRELHGMLTGFMDLVFEHEGRYFVLDYKSNRLDACGPEPLAQALLAHRYDVQAALYLLALHRLLLARLPGYDPGRHLGGAICFFLRGVGTPGHGVVHLGAPPELLHALDAAFAQEAPA